MIKYALRGVALCVTAFAMLALIRMQSSQAKMLLIVTGYHTPPTTTPTPPGCQTFINTNNGNAVVQVGAGCLPQASCPAEDAFPHDPASNIGGTGIICTKDGVNDCSSAISKAIADGVAQGGHGDIKFNQPGTYLVNLTSAGTYVNSQGITPPINAHFECGVPGVNIQMTLGSSTPDIAILQISNNNNTICGCNFIGGQTGNPPYLIGGNGIAGGCSGSTPGGCEASQGMVLVRVSNGTSGTLIEGNTFSKAIGDTAVQLNQANAGPSGPGPSGTTIKFNTYSQNAYYCNNVDAALGGTTTFSNNLLIDCAENVEWDTCTGGNVGTVNIVNNEVMSQSGNCFAKEIALGLTPGQSGCSGSGVQGIGYQGNGFTGSCVTSGVTFGGSPANANYCTGTVAFPAFYGLKAAGSSGTVTMNSNIVGPNCTCSPGAGNC